MMSTQEIRLLYCLVVAVSFIIADLSKSFRFGQKHILVYLIILFLAILIGGRPVIHMSDLDMYENSFNSICRNGWDEIADNFSEFGHDPLFSLIFFITSPFESFHLTLTLISFLSLWLAYKACKVYTSGERRGSSLQLFLCLIINFTFLNQQDNVMRIGIAFPLILIYFYYFYRRNYKKATIYGILAVGVHFSMAAAIIISILARFIQCRLGWYYLFYICILCASVAGVSLQSAAGMAGFGKAEFYSKLSESAGYQTGFRPDFALFNTIFLLFFIWITKKSKSQFMTYYIRLCVAFSCWFFLWFTVPFNDRVGAFSWNLIPIISYFGCIDKFTRKKIISGDFLFFALMIMNIVIFIKPF